MQDLTRLRVYSAAETLADLTYSLTRELPSEERYALGQQMRRSAVSVGSNIAEGCGRGGSPRELTHFLRMSLGSASELRFQLGVVRRLQLVPGARVNAVETQCQIVERMLTRLITVVRERTVDPKEGLTRRDTGLGAKKRPEARREPKTENRERRSTRDSSPTPSPGSRAAAGSTPSP